MDYEQLKDHINYLLDTNFSEGTFVPSYTLHVLIEDISNLMEDYNESLLLHRGALNE